LDHLPTYQTSFVRFQALISFVRFSSNKTAEGTPFELNALKCLITYFLSLFQQGIKLGRIPPDLRSGTSYLRSTASNLGSATAKWRSSTLILGSTAIKLNVKSHRSGVSPYKADHCESTNVNKQKLLNNRCPRDECSAYMHGRNMSQHISYRYEFMLTG